LVNVLIAIVGNKYQEIEERKIAISKTHFFFSETIGTGLTLEMIEEALELRIF
jgi:hypothetical protein